MWNAERMFEISTSGSNTGAQTFTPLFDGVVDKTLLHTKPHVNKTTHQIVHILDVCPVNSDLQNTSDLAIDRIKVWAIQDQRIWRDECMSVTCQEIDGVTSPVPGYCPVEK
jgi:hypothetical protein